MPAATPVYDLPYQVGTDPPCFGPGTGCDNLESIWCEFAELVEAQLDENDLIIGRTATAIPMAGISVTFPVGQPDPSGLPPAGVVVPFDTVVFDTDNMTSQSSDGVVVITPRRNGVYLVTLKFALRAPVGGATMFSTLDDMTAPSLSASGYQTTIRENEISASQYFQFTDTSPLPRSLRAVFGPGFVDATAELMEAKLSAFWVSDN